MKRFITSFIALVCLVLSNAHSHSFNVGNIVIDHPYATPTLTEQSTSAVYFRTLRNRGSDADRLLSANSVVANRISLHRMDMEVGAIEIPAKNDIRMGHSSANGYHLMLDGLKAPLKDGDSFLLTLRFEKAGERTVPIHVQTPRKSATNEHKH